ncbi:hypothetical protein ABZ135_18600 [Streptomyces sp. NPDC006339]|uniref:hypothetical protein n=1 Tax=Streptomyces sp. NPDC006339 TaxID=3156755 RepID=UPI00339ED14C
MKPLTVTLAVGALRGRISAEVFRANTLVALVQEWSDEETRADVIAALDNLAVVAADPADQAEIEHRIRAVECAADMDPAAVTADLDELERLHDQIGQTIAAIRRTHLVSGRVA